jgi:hypothetical protein
MTPALPSLFGFLGAKLPDHASDVALTFFLFGFGACTACAACAARAIRAIRAILAEQEIAAPSACRAVPNAHRDNCRPRGWERSALVSSSSCIKADHFRRSLGFAVIRYHAIFPGALFAPIRIPLVATSIDDHGIEPRL